MPAKSGKQYRFMAAKAFGKRKKGDKGPSKETAREFVEATPPEKRKMFSKKKHGKGMFGR